ncbi:MAG: argininosuccinate lyase [Bacteroidales bacterium]|jgi:argininosuccinate lyase|nr:argininosuccinate lyase [Bacteroidales bacterium]
MATLWNKGTSATEAVDRFTVGNDRILDLRLARYDVQGSRAHIRMLEHIGLLTAEEFAALDAALGRIAERIEAGDFSLENDVEDIHSQVELLLTRELGEVGKKIHSGRSRNDQVLVDLKLFLRDELKTVRGEVLTLFRRLQELSERHREVLLPGYTHAQVAMPSSFGLWFGAYAEALVDDMYALGGAYRVVNRNPLGSAAGYGNSFPLDRQMTTGLLDFDSPVYNSVAAQMQRGRTERTVASALGGIALTLNKFAADCCLYMCPNFGFIHFPDELTTGSSIMPHKKNPDVWEILRGKCNRILSCENEIAMLCSNMPHGYHRDYQLLKDILFPALELTHECLQMTDYMLAHIEINEKILENPLYDHLFTVEEVNRRTLAGVPFREAYRQVGVEVNEGRFRYGGGNPATMKASDLGHTHLGSLGNLCNDKIAALMAAASDWK